MLFDFFQEELSASNTKNQEDKLKAFFKNKPFLGRLSGSVCWASGFSSGHDLTVRGFEPLIRLCADLLLRAWSLLRILCLPLSLPLPCSHFVSLCLSKINKCRGAWVAQSVKRPTSAQVMISRSVSSSTALGSVLTTQSLEPVSDSESPSLSDPPPFMLSLCLKNK